MKAKLASKTIVAALMVSTALLGGCKQEEKKASDAKQAEKAKAAESAVIDPGSVKTEIWRTCSADVSADCVLKLADATAAGMDAGVDRATAYAAVGDAQARSGLKAAAELSFRAAMSDARQVNNPQIQAPLFAEMSLSLARSGFTPEAEMAAVLGDAAIPALKDAEQEQALRAHIAQSKAVTGKTKDALDYVGKLSDATPALKSIKLKAICDIGVLVAETKAADGLKIIRDASKDVTLEQIDAMATLAAQTKNPAAPQAKTALTQWQKDLAGNPVDTAAAAMALAHLQQSLGQSEAAYDVYKKAWELAQAGGASKEGFDLRTAIVAGLVKLGKSDDAKQFATQIGVSASQAADPLKPYALFQASRAQALAGAFEDATKLADSISWQAMDAGRPLRGLAMRDLTASKAAAGDQQGALEVVAVIKTQRERTQALSDVANAVYHPKPATTPARPKL